MTETVASPSRASLFFGDAPACKEWLNALPHANAAQALAAVLDAVRVFNRAAFAPLERLKCLELLRDKVAFLQAEQRASSIARTLPLVAPEAAAWSNARAVFEEMEAGYRLCIGAEGLEAHAALVAQRVIRYIGGQMQHHAHVYRRFEPALWARLHQQYAQAEEAGLAAVAVKDSLEGEDGHSTVAEAYVRAVLFDAARPEELDARALVALEALVRLWSHKVSVGRDRPAEGAAAGIVALAVDLAGDRGATAFAEGQPAPTQRVLDVSSLSRSIRRRTRALKGGEPPANLGLPPAACSMDPLPLLQRLQRFWCEGAAPPAGKPASGSTAGLVFGAPEIHFFVAQGTAFEQPDKERELSRQEKEDIAVFGRVSQRTQTMMLQERPVVTAETWDVLEEWPSAMRVARAHAGRPVAIGRLVGLRTGPAAPFLLGYVSALREEEARIVMTVALLPGRPEPVAVRAGDSRARGHSPWHPGFRLPAFEKIGVPASFVVPAAVAVRGRGLQTWEGGVCDNTVAEVLHAGVDFDRVTLSGSLSPHVA